MDTVLTRAVVRLIGCVVARCVGRRWRFVEYSDIFMSHVCR